VLHATSASSHRFRENAGGSPPEAYPRIAQNELGVSTESLLSALRPSAMLETEVNPEGATWKTSKDFSAHP
jgi:hypothetical protein